MSAVEVKQERLPRPGWTRMPDPYLPGIETISASKWTDGRAQVISTLVMTKAPDASGDVVLTWHVSVTERGERPSPRVLRRALAAFGMTGVPEDNHHPGKARNYFQPVDPKRRRDCECKATETTVVEPGGYAWTNPTNGPCRGCELAQMFPDRPCSLHPKGGTS